MGNKELVYEVLNKKGIKYEVLEHEAVHTINDMEKLKITDDTEIFKNLFLRDFKGKRHFLVLISKDKRADLKNIRQQISSTALSFASEERLNKFLGVSKGAVSPLGIINDLNLDVEVIIDKDLINKERLGCHPNDNTATVILSFEDLKKLIEEHGNKISYITIK